MTRPTEDAITSTMPAQLAAHTLQGYWAVVPYQNGLVTFRESPGGGAFVPAAHRAYAADLCNELNREIAHDGKWIVCWSEFDLKEGFPRCLHLLFTDKDGDTQFVVDMDESLAAEIHDHADILHFHAEPAWQQWREMIQDVGVKDSQKIANALGQPSANERAIPDMVASL